MPVNNLKNLFLFWSCNTKLSKDIIASLEKGRGPGFQPKTKAGGKHIFGNKAGWKGAKLQMGELSFP